LELELELPEEEKEGAGTDELGREKDGAGTDAELGRENVCELELGAGKELEPELGREKVGGLGEGRDEEGREEEGRKGLNRFTKLIKPENTPPCACMPDRQKSRNPSTANNLIFIRLL
jgi:hypothetical protein